MDINQLIRSVKIREPLWNRQHPQYKDRELASYLWSQVSTEVGVDVETARYKWRGLRDTYRVQLRKLKRPGLAGFKQNILKSRWEYFNEMTFVKDHIYLDFNNKTYRTNRKVNHVKDEDSHSFDYDGFTEEGGYCDDGGRGGGEYPSGEEEYQNLGDLCETEMTEGTEVLEKDQISKTGSSPGEIMNGGSSQDGEDLASRLTAGSDDLDRHFDKGSSLSSGAGQELYPKSFSLLSSNSFDDNFCFLLSILPQLKSLPMKRNLYVRIKMQELLLNEVVTLQTNGSRD